MFSAKVEGEVKMKLLFWVTAAAVLSAAIAIENKSDKTKRQTENIRTPQNLQYSLVLPHSRVSSFRALGNRRVSNPSLRTSKLPPYAVQMEPMVQYSQKDPLYDPNLGHLEDGAVNKNEIQAQPKILNIHDHGDLQTDDDQSTANVYGPPYGSLPTAPLYSHPHPHYYEEPEPIIEIIIKESNDSLPIPQQPPPQIIKKEPVQVFYVKYSKDPHHENKVIYEKPIAAVTPPTNVEEHHKETYVTVTPQPIISWGPSTTLRTIIKPDSEVYHSDSGVKVTFGSENKHQHNHHDDYAGTEGHEETAPRPAIAYPQQPQRISHHSSVPQESRPQQKLQYNEQFPRQPPTNNYRPVPPNAQSRIQFQQPFLSHEQQLPRQSSSHQTFRTFHSQASRQGPQVPTPAGPPPSFVNGPPHSSSGPLTPAFLNGHSNQAGPIGPPFSRPPGPTGPTFTNGPPRIQYFPPRPSSAPVFHPRPNQHPSNSPPRTSFHSGPSRPFNSGPQPQQFFNEPKYLQENYHTINTENVDPPKEQVLQSRPTQSFDFVPRPSSLPSPVPISQEEYNNKYFPQFHDQPGRPIDIPLSQHLPQQRQPQQFLENLHNKPGPSARPPTFSSPQFENYRPNVEQSTPIFHQQVNQQHQLNLQQQNPQQQIQQQQDHQRQQQHDQEKYQQHEQLLKQQEHLQQKQHHQQQQERQHKHEQQQKQLQQQRQQQHEQVLQQEKQQQHLQLSQQQQSVLHSHQFPGPESSHINNRFPGTLGPQVSPQPHYSQNPSEQTRLQQNNFHQQNVAQLVPQGGEIIPGIAKYEQHITVSGPGSTPQPIYSSLSSPTPTPILEDHQLRQNSQQEFYNSEQEQVRLQLAQNVHKQQEEIQKLQSQLLQAQQNQQQQHQQQRQPNAQTFQQNSQYQQNYNFPENNIKKSEIYNPQTIQHSHNSQKQYTQERSKPSSVYHSSTSAPFYQSTSRTIEITPTTQRYISSTQNLINATPESKKAEKKKKPTIELPDEVPDDLRQQLLSSGILDNADISILDYDKVGDTPLDSLPPDQLANFFSAGGGQQIAASDNRPVILKPNGEKVSTKINDDLESDQEPSASENIATVVAPPEEKKPEVEMKVVHFDPTTMQGQTIAQEYVKKDATRLEPVALNDKKYNRYLPLKVSGNQFPVPDILKGRKVTSVVVLAPVETEALNTPEHTRLERATENNLKGIKFVAGDSLQQLLKRPSTENFRRWLEKEKKTATEQQSVILLVTGTEDPVMEKEIFMYDPETMKVNKLSGDLSTAFVEAAENNSLSRDIEKLAIEGEGTPESFNNAAATTDISEEEHKEHDSSTEEEDEDMMSESSDNVPLYADFSSMKLNQDGSQVSISSGYSKTKKGRSFSHQ